MSISSRRQRVYNQFPDPVIGYELNPYYGNFSVIIPEATENLVTNPSVENAVTTNYTAYNGAMAAIATWQAYGAYGLQLTPAVSTESGFYYGGTTPITFTAGSTYTASVTIQGEEGKIYYIWVASTAGALIGSKRAWIGTGYKQRIWVTTWEPTGASRRIYVTRDGKYSDQNKFYADGLQVEAKSYPTTYCDGDMKGFLINEKPAPYLWSGLPGASKSTRSAQTRSGGREVNLLNLGLKVLTVVGLGMATLVDQSLPIPGFGELAQGTGTQAREFTLVTSLIAESGQRELESLRSGLIDAFKPDATVYDQPLILRYQAMDDDGNPEGECLDIICKYRAGLEGNWDNNQQERIALQFKMYMPFIQNTYYSGVSLGFQSNVANANNLVQRDINGVWSAMGTGISGGNTVENIIRTNDGSIYVGGGFTGMSGVANTWGIAKWSNGSWSAVGTGMNGSVYALAVSPDGNSIYAGGAFTLAGGVAGTSRIAKWDGSVWTPLSTGADGVVDSIAIDSNGILYAGGGFTNIGGVAANYVAKWNGAAWSAMGTGASGASAGVYVLKVDIRNNWVYAGGKFDSMGGASNTRNIARWDTGAWQSMGTGGDLGGSNEIDDLAIMPNGTVYVGGNFAGMGRVTGTAYFAGWNGFNWFNTGLTFDNTVVATVLLPDRLLIGGSFTTVNGITLPSRVISWNESTFVPLEITLPGTASVLSALQTPDGNLYLGFNDSGTAVSSTVATPNMGSSSAYPKIKFIGPGKVYRIIDYTTGKSMYFDLTLLDGETAILDFNPYAFSFISSARGNILNTILKGSDFNLLLQPGVNYFSTFIYGSTSANTKVVMYWQGQYWSKDGAAFK